MAKISLRFACVLNNAAYDISQLKEHSHRHDFIWSSDSPSVDSAQIINILMLQIRKTKLREAATHQGFLLGAGTRQDPGLNSASGFLRFSPRIWSRQPPFSEPVGSPSAGKNAVILSLCLLRCAHNAFHCGGRKASPHLIRKFAMKHEK